MNPSFKSPSQNNLKFFNFEVNVKCEANTLRHLKEEKSLRNYSFNSSNKKRKEIYSEHPETH